MLCACSAPVTVDRVDMRSAYEELNRTALSSDQLSEATRTVLRRAGLLDTYDSQPDAVITALRVQAIATGMRWPELYALAELNYDLGRRTKSKPMLLASALYAYAVLFPSEASADRPSPYSGQFHHATAFYNLALTQVLSGAGAEGTATLESGRQPLPFGSVNVVVDAASMKTAGGRQLESFVPTMNLEVQGFKNDYRSDGIGAPMAAGLAPSPQPQIGLVLPKKLRIPTSAVLTMDDPRRQLMGTEMTAELRVYTIYDTQSIKIGGHTVPLEYDQTAVRALFATEGKIWQSELTGLLNNKLGDPATTDNLYALEPHRPGRIPVVLVHGTASSPFRWADMVNDLLEDKQIRDHYEFWFFAYNTGNPIPLSADVLRQSLIQAVKSLGGVEADPALGRMVVIGHSQGGLLTKMIAIDSGDKIWNAVSDKAARRTEPEAGNQGPVAGVGVRSGASLRRNGNLHRHAAWRQLPRHADDRRAVPKACYAAADGRDRHGRPCGQCGRRVEIRQGRPSPDQHQRHVSRQSDHRGGPGDPGCAGHSRPFHHPNASGWPA